MHAMPHLLPDLLLPLHLYRMPNSQVHVPAWLLPNSCAVHSKPPPTPEAEPSLPCRLPLASGPAAAVSSSRQRQPAFSRVESASTVAVGPVPDCASDLFMRAGQPCITFLYAPAVSCGSTLQQLQWERLSFQSCFLHVAYFVGHSVKIAACMPLSLSSAAPAARLSLVWVSDVSAGLPGCRPHLFHFPSASVASWQHGLGRRLL